MALKKGREKLVDALRSEGVKFVFGLPGGQSIDILYDALYDAADLRPILVRHEQSAPFMAYAHSRLTGEPGVCHGTVGPGLHNMVAGIMCYIFQTCFLIATMLPVSPHHMGDRAVLLLVNIKNDLLRSWI